MNKTLFIILIVVSICIVLASATTYRKMNIIEGLTNVPPLPKELQDWGIIKNNEPLEVPANIEETVNANNNFAIEMYLQLNEKDKNIFYSPYSLSTALSMVYEGARGNTAVEMQKVFGFQENATDRHEGFKYLYSKINNSNSETKSSTANAAWVQYDYKILSTYLDVVKQVYGGNAVNLDFINQREESRKTINTWVEDQTNKKIVDLIPQTALKDNTRFVLTNAIYFNGKWKYTFDKKNTVDREFTRSDGTKDSVKMMTQRKSKFMYAEKEDVQILQLPYTDNDLVMRIVLPAEGELDKVESQLTVEKLTEWKSALAETEVNIAIPKFKMETKYGMVSYLKKLGIKDLFDERADLSGIDGTNWLFVSDVIHQAYVDVYEDGTEAAAATAVVGGIKTSVGPAIPSFIADHPFIFLIEDTSNGSILFMGRVNNIAS